MVLPLNDLNQLDLDTALSLTKDTDFYKQVINNNEIESAKLDIEKDYRYRLSLTVPDVVIKKSRDKKSSKDKKSKEDESLKKQRVQS